MLEWLRFEQNQKKKTSRITRKTPAKNAQTPAKMRKLRKSQKVIRVVFFQTSQNMSIAA